MTFLRNLDYQAIFGWQVLDCQLCNMKASGLWIPTQIQKKNDNKIEISTIYVFSTICEVYFPSEL